MSAKNFSAITETAYLQLLQKDMDNKDLIAPFKILTAIIDEDGTSVVAERETSSWEVAEQNLASLRRMWDERPEIALKNEPQHENDKH